ncbi:MAG: SH3 domain-containing protein, partial [Eubacteriales bacterium]|nr:SH3 domain-containing protein [Eubacteriales bacterium]
MKKQRDDAGRAVLHILCIAAGCLYLAGCAAAPSEYTVMGATNEVSRVTEEAYVPAFAGEDEEAYGGRTGTAALEEPADDKETAEADGENEGTKSGKQAYRVLISDVNLCDKPGGRVIRVIPSGSRVELLSDVEKGWYKVRYRGASGYVKEGSFKEDQDRLEAEQTKTAAEQQRRMKEEEAEKKAEEESRK